MSDQYATTAQLTARLSSAYTVPADSDKLLLKASELIDYETRGSAQAAFDAADDDPDTATLLANATCDQVEFWLEAGEESDVVGLTGQQMTGRLMISKLPPALAPRARRTLLSAGLLWSGVGAF